MKVKLSQYRPGQTLSATGISATGISATGISATGIPRISRQSAREGSNVLNSMHRPTLHQDISLVLIYIGVLSPMQWQPLLHHNLSKINISESVYFFVKILYIRKESVSN